MKSSTSRDTSSSGVNMESVSSSVGGLRKPFAALNAGAAAIIKPAPVKKTAIPTKPNARLIKDRLGGSGRAAVSGKVSVC